MVNLSDFSNSTRVMSNAESERQIFTIQWRFNGETARCMS